MTTPTRTYGNWGDVTLAEYAAKDILWRDASQIIAAFDEWRGSIIVERARIGDPIDPADSGKYWTPKGEAYVAEMHDAYIAAWQAGDEVEEIRLTRAWLSEIGTLACMGVKRILESR